MHKAMFWNLLWIFSFVINHLIRQCATATQGMSDWGILLRSSLHPRHQKHLCLPLPMCTLNIHNQCLPELGVFFWTPRMSCGYLYQIIVEDLETYLRVTSKEIPPRDHTDAKVATQDWLFFFSSSSFVFSPSLALFLMLSTCLYLPNLLKRSTPRNDKRQVSTSVGFIFLPAFVKNMFLWPPDAKKKKKKDHCKRLSTGEKSKIRCGTTQR